MKNILLIENEDGSIKTIISSLGLDNYFIDVAETSSKGYELAIKNLPDLVICNKLIYDAEENEVLHRLRDDSFISTIPFVFLVDKDLPRLDMPDKSNAFDYYIVKPFKKSEIVKVVKLALEKYSAVIKKSERKLHDLMGSISFALPHEFFTPLNGILGFTEILIKDLDHLSKPEILQMLSYINFDAQRLKKITENFLAFAQLEMISKDSEKVNSLRNSYFINPKEIIISAATQIAREAGRDEDLVLELEDGVIRMTESYLKKIITEIVSNAFKFSEKGTPVIVSMFSNDMSVMISVSDNGRGMLPEQIASIGAYMQFDRKIYEQQGSGLGLIIAKKITEIYGGQFAIESIVNESTKVNIVFDN